VSDLRGVPKKELIGKSSRFSYRKFGFKNLGLTLELRFLVGLGSSGRLVGIIYTLPWYL
jgi:hypothetical protein